MEGGLISKVGKVLNLIANLSKNLPIKLIKIYCSGWHCTTVILFRRDISTVMIANYSIDLPLINSVPRFN